MKRIWLITLITFLTVSLFASTVPVMAAGGAYTKIQTGFSVDPSHPGVSIEKGSTIHHLANGETDVYGVDGSLTIRALD